MKRSLFNIITLIINVTALISILGYFGQFFWAFDLFSHFKLQYLIILSVGSIIIYLLRKKYPLIILPFIVLLLFEIVPLYFGGNRDHNLSETTKIVFINLLSSNREFDKVENYIEEVDPDLIILQEFTSTWQRVLEPKLNNYKYRLAIPRDDNFGIAIYSNSEISGLKEIEFGDAGVPSIYGEILLGETKATIIATHPLPPISSQFFDHRNEQLSEVGKLVSKLDGEAIVIGDLNCSSFSSHFKDLISNSKLVDSRKGFGLLTTWPTWFPPAQTTLDHCLITEGIMVKSREIGDEVGSDHLPIFIELGVR